jgi:DNA-binding PadR family transcriptional regulator
MFGPHFFRHERHTRFFEKGDLKYIILDLLKDKPSHGYEIIKSLENRFMGFYSPSAGSVYPTLQLLEDMGYVKSLEQDGKKIYTITDEGRKYLVEKEDIIDKIKMHMHHWGEMGDREFHEMRDEFRDVMEEFRDMAHVFRRKASRLSPDKMNRIKDVMRKAGRDIESIINE